ncbi:LacI family DNA-binding transcriptional regulator [Sungkyunkwania multivorans]|uniref:LacI family DNA-binding transcriptional regulator n=1 Tax=Sungkyunkwania multivorans TaxID=1173618 RepID=A0ABW3CUZ3_9FLAO
MSNVTLKDIAEILGVSVTTVSKALKDYKDVKKETREAVRLLAEKLNYKPNPLALNLRNKESKTIGVIIPRIDHNFYSNVLNGIIEEAESRGYLVIILFSGDSAKLEKEQVELLKDKRVDGVLVAVATEAKEVDHLKELMRNNIPLVLFDKVVEDLKCSKVSIDDEKAAFDAVTYLIDSGCGHIAHLRGPLPTETYTNRYLGYKKAVEAAEIQFDPSLVYVSEELSFEDGYDLAKKVMSEHPEVDAIFAMTDLVAMGCLAFCKDEGIKVPEQVSIMGFSNWFMSRNSSPKLSTVDQPITLLGKEATSILINEIKEKKEDSRSLYRSVKLPTKVIARETTR